MGRLRASDIFGVSGAALFGFIVYQWVAVRDQALASLAREPVPSGPAAPAMLKPERDRLRKAREQAEAEEILRDLMFEPYRANGRLNPHLLELAGIPFSRMEEMETLMDEFREQLSSGMEARREANPEESGEGVIAFRVPADPDAAEVLRRDFEAQVRSKFGNAAARIFVPQVLGQMNFAGWGRYDLRVRFSMQHMYGGAERVAEYEVTDPDTGKQVASGATSKELHIRNLFGSAFSDVKPEP